MTLLSAIDYRANWMHFLFDQSALFAGVQLPHGVEWHRRLWAAWQQRLTEFDHLQAQQAAQRVTDNVLVAAMPISRMRRCTPHGVRTGRMLQCGWWQLCPYCYARKFERLWRREYPGRYLTVSAAPFMMSCTALTPYFAGLRTYWQRLESRGTYGQLLLWPLPGQAVMCDGKVVTVLNTSTPPASELFADATTVHLREPGARMQCVQNLSTALRYPAQLLLGDPITAHMLAMRAQGARWWFQSGDAFRGRR